MKIIEVTNYQEMSKAAADYIISKVRQSPNLILGLATGGTPVGTYKYLVEDHKKNKTSYKDVTTFNLDEYVGLAKENPQSYHSYMNEHFFNHIDINPANTHVPNGKIESIKDEPAAYEELIKEAGGIDLQVLGIGQNGHIGFNEPGTPFSSNSHIIELAPSTIEANARYFESPEEVPTKANTMGINTIMKSKEILLLVSGENKRQALSQLLEGKISEDFPASALLNHPNVVIIADEAARSGRTGIEKHDQ
ncbi:glucosamine-6-phosphate deaminase [Peribacillus sp. FSL H8-0477]|uniref:glucosamine-6-phosphate deaminase n=1 Tax=Peribacillus sp. FSL H8-0477 TaxID=2921388 RepID=UPI0030F597B2